jgi:hypothetical protein
VIATRLPRTRFLDLLLPTPFAADDRNFIDAIHLRRAAADVVVAHMAAGGPVTWLGAQEVQSGRSP